VAADRRDKPDIPDAALAAADAERDALLEAESARAFELAKTRQRYLEALIGALGVDVDQVPQDLVDEAQERYDRMLNSKAPPPTRQGPRGRREL
jgi:hypothetical protein